VRSAPERQVEQRPRNQPNADNIGGSGGAGQTDEANGSTNQQVATIDICLIEACLIEDCSH
jgi:hypothetical protein